LKFVVSEYMDVVEIKTQILHYLRHFEPSDVILMPLGSNRDSLNANVEFAMAESIKHGWRYTPRLHVDMFNDKRSV
jgi:7-carboxy-7-deazaguanine synthase